MFRDKEVKGRMSGENHVWIEGRQFVSLNRFTELRNETNIEMQKLNDEVKRLTEENNALKVLLKSKLNAEE